MTLNNLIINISILIAATLLFGQSQKYYLKNKIIQNILLGIIFGTISVLSMVYSFQYSPGLIFDGRSIILGVAGIIGGYVPALISITITLIYRIYLEGSGMHTGIMVILLSGLSGAMLHHYIIYNKMVLNLILVYIYSLCLHVAIIIIFYLSITEEGNVLIVIKSVWKAFVIVYPFIMVFIYFIFNDQKRRMNMEVSLIESGKKIRSLSEIVEQTAEGIAQADLNGKIIFVNKAWSDMHGYSNPNECLNKNLSIFHNKEQIENEVIPFNEKVNKYGTYKGEVGHITKDGKQFITLMTTTLLKNTQGKPFAIAGFAQDITERKLADITIRESEEKFRTINENSPDSIIIHDLDMNIMDANKKAIEVFGYSRPELLKKKVTELHPETELKHSAQVLDDIKKKKNLEVETRFVRKDGSIFIAEAIPSAYTIRDKQIIHVVIRDITERKQIEEELTRHQNHLEELVKERTLLLEQANKELDSFSHSISHDLKAPLRGIDGYTRMLIEDYTSKLDKKGKRLGSVIQSNTKKMNKLIDDLLAFSRLGRVSISFSTIDMKNMVNSIYHEVTDAEERKRIKLHC
ncbi:MAG: PAS domain S-box protein [Candidatus Marinimicrobia bacterium]|nr:PAS domain S-box protein [Candidatus Neomarinimicrobiota bacterium]